MVAKLEIEENLKLFKKYKSRGSDGWIMEFFIALYDMMVDDLVRRYLLGTKK